MCRVPLYIKEYAPAMQTADTNPDTANEEAELAPSSVVTSLSPLSSEVASVSVATDMDILDAKPRVGSYSSSSSPRSSPGPNCRRMFWVRIRRGTLLAAAEETMPTRARVAIQADFISKV